MSAIAGGRSLQIASHRGLRVDWRFVDPHRVVLPAIACAGLLLVPACDTRDGSPAIPSKDAPVANDSSDDPAHPRFSEAGLYRVSLRPQDDRVPLGRIHAWILRLETRDGESFLPRRIAFSGGMPQHGHGFETEPRVTRGIGGDAFLVEGVKFHMAGDWTLRVEVVGPEGPDVAVFQVRVEP